MSKASISHQVYWLFHDGSQMFAPEAERVTRHEEKADMRARGQDSRGRGDTIHGWGTFHREMEAAQHFVEWAKQQYGVRMVRDLAPHMVQEYLAERRSTVKPNTLAADLLGIRRLDQLAAEKGWIKASFVPEDAIAKRQFSPRGAYTAAEAQAVIDLVRAHSPAAARVLEVQRSGGLRLREALRLSPAAFFDKHLQALRPGIDFQAQEVFVTGKGGRQRTISPLDWKPFASLSPALRFPLRVGSEPGQRRQIEKLVKRACDELGIRARGTHGLRALAVREYLAQKLAEYPGDRAGRSAARRAAARWLGHNRTDILKFYLVDPK